MKSHDYSEYLAEPAHMMVLLTLIGGLDYPSAIAKVLGKSQPTVSQQLSELMAAGLVKLGRRDKAQRYEIVWGPMIKELHHVMETGLTAYGSYRGVRFQNQVRREGFDRIVPGWFFQDFLKRYFLELREKSGIQKNFSEICISMFQSIDELKKEDRDRIAERLGVDSVHLRDVSSIIGLVNDHVELSALEDYADDLKSGEQD